METSRTLPWGAFTIAIVLALSTSAWLHFEYQSEARMQAEVLKVRGEGILTALEAGIRSHRRIGAWFEANIESVLDETAALPGILGLAVFRDDASCLASVGQATSTLQPTELPRWVDGHLLLSRRFNIPMPDGEPGEGRGQRGWRWRESGGWGGPPFDQGHRGGPPPLLPGEGVMGRDFDLSILMDGRESREAIALDRRRFILSLGIDWLAIILGLFAYILNQRRTSLATELGLARERAQHLEELNQLAAGLAHETKNPLSLIRGMAQSCLNRSGGSDSVHDTSRRIVDEADRLVGRINGFLAYSRPKAAELREVDAAAVVSSVVALFGDEAENKGVRLRTQVENLKILADSEMLRQILVNLLTNSLFATRSGGNIEVSVTSLSPRAARLEVSDSGIGIAREDLPRLCEPYFSRREGGTGLGLSIVNQLVAAQGWTLSLASEPEKGTRACLDGLKIVEPR